MPAARRCAKTGQLQHRATLAVTVGALAGIVLYGSVFTWLGMVNSRAVGVGLTYVVLWEGLFTSFVSGARLLNVRRHTVSLVHALDPQRFAGAGTRDAGVAAATSAALFVNFL